MRKSVEFMFRKKPNKSIVFFNNRDIVSLIESCGGQSVAIQNDVNREAVEKTVALSKLNNKYLNISLSFFSFDFAFNSKIFVRTDIATKYEIRIHVALKINSARSDLVYFRA